MGPTTDELNNIKKSRKSIITLVAAIIAAATPGVYSSLQTAKQEWRAKLKSEQSVRDKQEHTLQSYVRANEKEIDSLRSSIKDLHSEMKVLRTQLVSVLLATTRRSRIKVVREIAKPAPQPAPSKKLPRPQLKSSHSLRQQAAKVSDN